MKDKHDMMSLLELIDTYNGLTELNKGMLLGAAAMLKLVAAQQQTTTDDKSA